MGKRKPPPTKTELKAMKWGDYIKSKHWRDFRKSLDTDDASCQLCGKMKWTMYKTGSRAGTRKKKPNCQFQCHHKNYDNLGEETRDDVLLTCRTCHSLGHDLEMASRTRGGVYKQLYDLFCALTPWEYTPFKDRKK